MHYPMQRCLQYSTAAELMWLACLGLQQVEVLAVLTWTMERIGTPRCVGTSTSRHVVQEASLTLMAGLQTASTTTA